MKNAEAETDKGFWSNQPTIEEETGINESPRKSEQLMS